MPPPKPNSKQQATGALPSGWVKTSLGEITLPSRARAMPSSFPDMPYIGMEHVESNTMSLTGQGSARDVRSMSVKFSAGDVLYGKMRPYLNKVWVATFNGLCSAEFFVFPKHAGLDSRFLAHRLNSQDFVTFANLQVSGDRPRVPFERLAAFPVLLPPAAEQARIVSKLETLLSRVEAGENTARRSRDRLQGYRSAILDAALTGELTRAWRKTNYGKQRHAGDVGKILAQRIAIAHRSVWEATMKSRLPPDRDPKDSRWKLRYPAPTPAKQRSMLKVPKEWVCVTWSQVGLSQNGRPFPSEQYSSSGIKLLRPGNLYADGTVQWNEKNTRFLPEPWAERNPDLVVGGRELVINLTAQSLKDDFLGRVCLTGEGERCLLNQRLARLTPVLGGPEYFLVVFRSPLFRRFVSHLNSGSLIQHMFTSQIATFCLPFPPLSEQKAIVSEVERRLQATGRLQSALDRQIEHAQHLRQSLQTEAFAGKLVSQSTNDEPASNLLALLRAARVAEAKMPRTKPMARKSSASSNPVHRPLLDVLRAHGSPMTPEQLFRESGYEHEFLARECHQEVVDRFYDALRQVMQQPSPVQARRRDDQNVVLEVSP